MSKNLEELILGAESQAAASAAVCRAVKRADAAGFPPAYCTESGAMAWLEKDPAKFLELRLAARREKHYQDEECRERHRQILKLLDGPQGEWIRQKAHEQIDKWERNQLCIPRYWVMWREWLAMPAPHLAAAVLLEDDLGVSMRQNSPFDHSFCLVTPDIRKPADGKAKSTEELMFGVENQAATAAAVRRAIERADALGLPRAYKELPLELEPDQVGQDQA
jgi:hypothetical protein